MNTVIRPVQPSDVKACARIIFDAFASIADKHNFPRDFPSMEMASNLARGLAGDPAVFGVVAERTGDVVGSNFLHMRDSIGAVGPITVDPAQHGSGVGRRLMQAVVEHGKRQPALRGIRLVQDAFNTTSISLYASLGFEVKEPLALMRGTPTDRPSREIDIRPVTEADVDRCAALCEQIHGLSRINDIRAAMEHFKPFLLERDGRIRAYCTTPTFWITNHGVAETTADMQQLLLGAAAALGEPIALLAPTRNAELFRWCLSQGLRVVKPLTLMTMGEYQESRGCFFPSVLY